MNNGKTLRDVANVGDDHMNEVDLNDIQQIEIVRGHLPYYILVELLEVLLISSIIQLLERILKRLN